MARRATRAFVLAGSLAGAAAVVTMAAAEPIVQWRTPDGKSWFGDRPPAGSVRVGELESLTPIDIAPQDATGAPPDASDERARAAREGREVIRQRSERREAERERRAALATAVVMTSQSVVRGTLGWVVVGSVRNTAADPVHDVQVGAGGTWSSTEPPAIPPGGEATFRLEVRAWPYTEHDGLPTVEIDWKERR